MKILHIAPDEKFIEAADSIFEIAFPKQNTFIITVQDISAELKHVEKKRNYFFYEENDVTLSTLSDILGEYDIVILHSLDYFKSRLVLKSTNHIKFVWIFWGLEFYGNPYIFRENIYGEVTYKRFVKTNFYRLKNLFRPLFYKLIYGKKDNYNSITEAAKKVAVVVASKEDYDLILQKRVINATTKHFEFSYYPIEFLFKDGHDRINGNNILLGNSASFSNNHIEAFEILKKINIGNRKIIVPLSYGDNEYALEINNEGDKIFGNNFFPLLEFMKLDEYNKTISSCGITIMNHYRQQAVGNIIAMLWMGSKVYLDERNTVYHYLKRIGCDVYLIRDLSEDTLENLSEEQVVNNRKVLKKEIGMESIVNNLKKNLKNI